nr:reverse transcriptase domain-containing protein [Tanacetum cinerariifolium]
MVEESSQGEREVAATEEVLINPSFSDQKVTIGEGLSKACKDQLKHLLKDDIGVFAWEPSDMTGMPHRIIEHTLNVNPSMDPVCQKRRTFSMEKSRVVTNEVEEGKFLGYIVTSEGIRANPKKTKALAVCRTIPTIIQHSKEHNQRKQTLVPMDKGGKGSFPINEESYYGSPITHSTLGKETLYAYLAVLAEAVSAVLLTDRKGRQCPVQYVSRTPNEAKRNYAPMEKLALSLIHMTRRLRKYFEAHPVKVITEQPIRNILNNSKTSKKLENFAVELGAYNITYIPRNAVKGQVLEDFLSKAPEWEKEELYFRMPEVPLGKDNIESWNLFTDEASSPKGSGAGLVLIGPNGIEYTYALCLTFSSTNNEAEYEALLAGLRIARQMSISNIEVKVDSKLVASHINRNYEASKENMIKYLVKAKEFGVPQIIVTDNGAQLVNDPFKRWCRRFEIHQMNTKVAHPQANRLVERANRSLMEVEICIPTYWTLMIREGYNEEEMRLNLDLLQERRETAAIREARYKKQSWNNTTTKRFACQVLGLGNLCSEETKQVGLRTKASWDQNGKDPTGSWKHTKMAPIS